MMASGDEIGFEGLYGLWIEGSARIAATPLPLRRTLERVVDAILPELRRRLGGAFTTDELARYYLDAGTEWCFEIAIAVAPSDPEAWDIGTVAAAAFARCTRFASDFGGGRRIVEEG